MPDLSLVPWLNGLCGKMQDGDYYIADRWESLVERYRIGKEWFEQKKPPADDRLALGIRWLPKRRRRPCTFEFIGYFASREEAEAEIKRRRGG